MAHEEFPKFFETFAAMFNYGDSPLVKGKDNAIQETSSWVQLGSHEVFRAMDKFREIHPVTDDSDEIPSKPKVKK